MQEGHHDPLGIGHPAGLEDHVVDRVSAFEELFQGSHEVVPDFAAHAAVGEIDRVILYAFNQLGVDVDGTEIIDQYTDSKAVMPVENAIEQRRFSGTQETGEERYGNGIAPRNADGFRSRSRSEYRVREFVHSYL